MRKKPHGSVGLGSLPLQELSQQPLHFAVSGVCTFHCLLRVKTNKRTQCILQYTAWRCKVLLDTGGKGEKPQTFAQNLPEAVIQL